MATSTRKSSLGFDAWDFPLRTTGPLGVFDAGDPFAPSKTVGDTPGPLAIQDHAGPKEAKAKEQKAVKKQTPLEAAFENAKESGWLPFFSGAATLYGQEVSGAEFGAEVLMGIAYRESRLNKKWLSEAGDHGNGYGLMQADVRSYKEWVDSGKWKDARECILKGAEVLAAKLRLISDSQGKTNPIKTLSGAKYNFFGKTISGSDLLRVGIAAYNCGLWSYYHYSKGNDVDRGTTGKDYSEDVLYNSAVFKRLMPAESRFNDFPMPQNRNPLYESYFV